MSDRLERYIESRFGAAFKAGNPNVTMDCPSCGKENHFSFHLDKAVGHCWVCGYAVNLARLICDFEGIPYHLARIRASVLLQRELGATDVKPEARSPLYQLLLATLAGHAPTAKEDVPTLTLPKYSIPIDHKYAAEARRYLQSRGYTERHWKHYDLHYVHMKPEDRPALYRHIVFPHYDSSGKLAYYTTRAAFNPQGSQPKSLHPPLDHRSLLFGDWCIKPSSQFVVLVEGPLDMLALAGFSVALLGKNISDEQVLLLAQRFRRIIVALDNDATAQCVDVAWRLHNAGVEDVRFCVTYGPGGQSDPGDLAPLGPTQALQIVSKNGVKTTLFSYLKSTRGLAH